MQSAWVGPIRDLCDILLHNEQCIQLLRDIDVGTRSVLTADGNFDDVVSSSLARLHDLTRASATHFFLLYRAYEDKPLLVHTTAEKVNGHGERLSALLTGQAWQNTAILHVAPESRRAAAILPETEGVLISLVPLPDAGLVGVIVLESPNPTAFLDDSVTTFISAVSEQLSNLFHLYDNWRKRDLTNELLSTFLDKKLKPSQCLKVLASQIPRFLPAFGPLMLREAPQVQILFYKEGDKYLTIRASTGNERPITRVDTERSVCGYLIEDRNLEYYLCDPTTEPRYNWFLGRSDGLRMRSELAVPVKDDGRLIAVLNLESPTENAFFPQHIDAARWAANEVASWIAAILNRIDIGIAKEEALSNVMESYVIGHGRMLSHNAGNKLTGLATTLDNLVRETKDTHPELNQRLSNAHRSAQRFRTFLRDFISDPKDAAKLGSYSIRKLVEDAIDLVSDLQRQLIDTHRIAIEFPPSADAQVYCSKLFRQHLYNLLDNSLFWLVKKRGTSGECHGTVIVSIDFPAQSESGPSSNLNERCRVTVRDNGPGVSDDILKELREFPLNYTNRRQEGGSGYGLWALRQYADTIGAWIDLDSCFGEFFEVAILLDVFHDRIHRQKKWGKGW